MPRLIGLVLLALSVVYAYAMLMPTLGRGMLTAGDDAIHAAYSLESARLWAEERSLFGWTDLYGLGEPLYLARPPGFYWVVLALHGFSFGAMPVVTAQKLAYLLSLVLYPGAIYYLLRRWCFSPLIRGLGALLALGAISTFGHTLDAYYSLGLAKQAFALLLFPVALGKLHGIVRHRERLWTGGLLVAALILNHPYIAWVFALLGAAMAALPDSLIGTGAGESQPWRALARRLGRAAAVLLLGAGLCGFWLVPYACSPEIQSVYALRGDQDRGFDKQAETAANTWRHWLDGSLLDRAPAPGQVFGGVSPWAWRDNAGRGRWPVLTVFSIAGAVFLLVRRRGTPASLVVFGGVLSSVLFLGSDDVPLLRLIPLERDFQYIHVAPMVELFATCLAAVGLIEVGSLVARLLARRVAAARVPGVQLAVTLLVVAPFVGNILVERWRIAAERVVTRRFEVDPRGQTAWSLRNPGNDAVADWADAMRDAVQPHERFLADAPEIWKGSDIFHFTLSPAYLGRANIVSPLIVNLMGGVNQWVHFPPVRGLLTHSAVLSDLLRVRAVLLVSDAGAAPMTAGAEFPRHVAHSPWPTVARAAAIPAFGFTAAKPILFVGDQPAWELACREWAARVGVMARDEAARWPFLVWCNPAWRDVDRLPISLQAVTAVAAPGSNGGVVERVIGADAWRAYTASGGRVVAAVPWGVETAAPVVAEFSDVTESRHRRAVRVRVASPGLLYLKAAYYRGWQVRVDGKPAPLVAASPGFNACWLEAGEHTVEFRYAGATGRRLGMGISLGSMLLIAACTGIGLRKRHS